MVNRRALLVGGLGAVLLAAAPLPAAEPPRWLGDDLPLPLSVKTPADIGFKAAAERQYLIFNLMAGGKLAYQRGDYAGAVEKWETLLRISGLDPQIEKAVTPFLTDARARAAHGGNGAHAEIRPEPVEVPPLLLGHARHQLGFGAIAPKNRQLARVDSRRAIFARLIDAQHRIAVAAPIAWPPAAHPRRRLRLRNRIIAAPLREMMAFHPASEMPRKRYCTSSHRTRGACVICLSRSAVLPPPVIVDVQVVKPSKILASTPA